MNRLVLIGNGFDLAHRLPTSYEDFINWYWRYRVDILQYEKTNVSDDKLCKFIDSRNQGWDVTIGMGLNPKRYASPQVFIEHLRSYSFFKFEMSSFMNSICQNIKEKGWVDIENEYYKNLIFYALDESINDVAKYLYLKSLNDQLDYLRELLARYLSDVCISGVDQIESIYNAIYAPIQTKDIASTEKKHMDEHVAFWNKQDYLALKRRKGQFLIKPNNCLEQIKKNLGQPLSAISTICNGDYPLLLRLPNSIKILNFNYTATPLNYLNKTIATINYIHGEIDNPSAMIFGYGDEIDERFPKLKELNDKESLRNVKSIRYLEAANYRDLLSFINAEPFQVLIMGHSCGNSDRTLLNTIFEHPNCVSIKPYYYQKTDGTDDYLEKVQNISRNFTDMKLMRDRVVNKTQCEPLTK